MVMAEEAQRGVVGIKGAQNTDIHSPLPGSASRVNLLSATYSLGRWYRHGALYFYNERGRFYSR